MSTRKCHDLKFLSFSTGRDYSINLIPNRILAFNKYARCKINIYKSVAFLQTNHNPIRKYNNKQKNFKSLFTALLETEIQFRMK